MKKLFSFLKSKEFIILALLISLAFFLRIYNLDKLMAFTFDQGRDLYVLQEITRGKLTLIGPTTGIEGFFIGPFMYYFLLPGFILSNGHPFGVMFWSTLWVTLGLAFIYYILKPIMGFKWAFLGLILVIFMPGSIVEARFIWNPTYVAPVLLASIWALFASQRKPKLLIISFFLYGLALQTELAYTFFLSPAYIWWIAKHLKITSRSKKLRKTLLVSIFAFALTFTPQLFFELRHDFIMTGSLIRNSQNAEKRAILTDVWKEKPVLMAHTLQTNLFSINQKNGVWFLPILMLALYLASSSRKKKEEVFLLWIFILPFAGQMFFVVNHGNFFSHYLASHYVFAVMISLLAIKRIRYRKTLAAIFLITVLVSFSRFSKTFYSPEAYGFSLEHQLAALNYIRDNQTEEKVGLEVYVPNQLPINYQYLNEWLARSGRATPIDFTVKDFHQEYFLLREPANVIQVVLFDIWMEKWHQDADCIELEQFGILTVEKCLKI